MQFRRKIQPELEKQINTREIVVLTGMRRTGKTTLMKMLFNMIQSKNKVFLDLQNILDRTIFDEIDYNNILNNLKAYNISSAKKAYIFIDEIQFKAEVVEAVKYLYDHYNIKFFITGSSSFYLKNLFPESLAGRKVVFELFPLFFEEFLLFNDIGFEFNDDFKIKSKAKNFIEYQKLSKYYEEYLMFGGFPQVVLEKDNNQKELMLKDIFNSYFQIDILNLADFKKIDAFKKLIFLLMERVGSKLDITKLASLIGVSRDTVYSYISLLEGTYFISLVSPFTRNKDKEISGTKKVFICDNGFINLFSKVSKGSLLENSVFQNLKKYGTINYYQKRSGTEIDFIISSKSRTAIEVKTNPDEHDLNRLKRISEQLKIKDHFLVSLEYTEMENSIPAYLI
jgi:predicted AAA+ superfamily ATPase